MTLRADNQGFLVGDPMDINRLALDLHRIAVDVAAMRRIALPAALRENNRASSTPVVRNSAVAEPRPRNVQGQVAATPGQSVTPGVRQTTAGAQQAAPATPATPKRNNRGQFTRSGEPDSRAGKSQGWLGGVAERLSEAVKDGVSGSDRVDPTIAATKEIATPLMRGYDVLFGGENEDRKQNRWLNKIFKRLNIFHKEDTAFNKANRRALENIEENTLNQGDSSFSGGAWGSILGRFLPWLWGGIIALFTGIGSMVMGALGTVGAGLLTAFSTVLGAIFTPVGLAIAAAGALAWGLFTDSGRAFFSNLGTTIADTWNGLTSWLKDSSPNTMAFLDGLADEIRPVFDYIKESWTKISDSFSEFIDSAKGVWSWFHDLFSSIYDGLKSLPIIGPAIEKIEAAASVVKEKAATAAGVVKEKAATAADIVKEKAAGTVDYLKNSSPKTMEAIDKVKSMGGKVWNGAKSGGKRLIDKAFNTGVDYSAGNIDGLDDAHTRALVASTAMTESSGGKLDAMNAQGYMGRYQAGAGWLADAGLVDKKGVKDAMKKDGFTSEWKWAKSGGMTKFLDNQDNWTGGLSKEKYLASAEIQDAAYKTNSDKSKRDMERMGIIKPGDSQEVIAGLLKARHIAGLGGAKAVARGGTGPMDANGTAARDYFNDVVDDKPGFIEKYNTIAPIQTASSAIPTPPTVPQPPKINEAPEVRIPLNTPERSREMTITMPPQEPGRDLSDRGIAHIVTGGFSAG